LIEYNRDYIEEILKPKINEAKYQEHEGGGDMSAQLGAISKILDSYPVIFGILDYFKNLNNLVTHYFCNSETPRLPLVKEYMIEANKLESAVWGLQKVLYTHIGDMEKMLNSGELTKKAVRIAVQRLELEQFIVNIVDTTITFIQNLGKGVADFEKGYGNIYDPMDDHCRDIMLQCFVNPIESMIKEQNTVYMQYEHFCRGYIIRDLVNLLIFH
jgi:hypothetical protein